VPSAAKHTEKLNNTTGRVIKMVYPGTKNNQNYVYDENSVFVTIKNLLENKMFHPLIYVRVGILFPCGKHLNNGFISLRRRAG